MARIDTHRASYQNLSHIRIGKSRQSNRIATDVELRQIKHIIDGLNRAATATNESSLKYELSTAFRTLTNLTRNRFTA